MERLRFAPVIRVSSDKQKKKGESLKTQEAQIRSYVDILKGEIPDYCWGYMGQEHATPNQERALLDQLLADATKDLYDAVIVVDASRWSRDNLKNKQGLRILLENNKRFFVGTMEFDLRNPEHQFYLGVAAEIGELQARQQAQKSIINKANRAKAGRPASGRLPYGRTWSVAEGWGVDFVKKEGIEQAARRYLAGEGIPQIAASMGMNASVLHKIITKRAGTDWPCKFLNPQTRQHEAVIMQVPPLLDDDTIAKIHERVRTNKTYTRGNTKYLHLLRGHVYCRKCGYAMASFRNYRNQDYYRHSKYGQCAGLHKFIPAPLLENTVLVRLVETFGDSELIAAAVARAIPDMEQRAQLQAEHDKLTNEKRKKERALDRLVTAVANGELKSDDIIKQRASIDSTMQAIQFRLSAIENALAHIPDPKKIRGSAKWAAGVVGNLTRDPKIIFKRDYKWKRNLIEKAFSGVDRQGNRLGVYVDYVNGHWEFELRGEFFTTVSGLPLNDDELVQAFHIDPDTYDEDLAYVKSNMLKKLNAYHQFRLHQ